MPDLTMPPRRRPVAGRNAGFTLAELAVVLIIIALLLGSMLAPVGAQLEERNRRRTLDQLEAIEQALIGFAIIHRRLPCPSLEADPASPAYGLESPPPCDDSVEGRLPWRELGLAPTDAWGSPRHDAATPWSGHWRYRADRAFTRKDLPIDADTLPDSNLQIYDHDSRAITTTSASRAVAVIYSTGRNLQPDGRNASYAAHHPAYQAGEPTADYDDLLVWIGQPLLIARLAQAGRL